MNCRTEALEQSPETTNLAEPRSSRNGDITVATRNTPGEWEITKVKLEAEVGIEPAYTALQAAA